jgi:hypothetical protein
MLLGVLSACGTENLCVLDANDVTDRPVNEAAFTPDCQSGGKFDYEEYLRSGGTPLSEEQRDEQTADFR